MVQGNVSSLFTTPIYKYVFPLLWFGYMVRFPWIYLGDHGAIRDIDSLGWLIIAGWLVGAVWIVFLATRLRFLRVEVDGLRARSLRGTLSIHASQVVRADKLWFTPLVVRVVYRTPTGHDKSFWFMPSVYNDGGIVDENLLPDLNAMSQRSSQPAA